MREIGILEKDASRAFLYDHGTKLPFITFKYEKLIIKYRYLNNGLMDIRVFSNNIEIEYDESKIYKIIDARENYDKIKSQRGQ